MKILSTVLWRLVHANLRTARAKTCDRIALNMYSGKANSKIRNCEHLFYKHARRLALAMLGSVLAIATAAPNPIEQKMSQGQRAFDRGALAQAANYWREAADSYAARGDQKRQANALVLSAEAYQALGQYQRAFSLLFTARKIATEIRDKDPMAAVAGSLGKVYLSTGSIERAKGLFKTSIRLASETHNTLVTIASLNNMGKLLSDQGRTEAARANYARSVHLAQRMSEQRFTYRLEHARAVTGLASLSLKTKTFRETSAWLARASALIRRLPRSREKAAGLVALGRLYQMLYNKSQPARAASARWTFSAYRAFVNAAVFGARLGDLKTQAYAQGYLAQIYAREGRPRAALQLSRRAVFAAQQANAPEISYRWQWQIARLMRARGDIDAAIAAYRRAVYSLQSVRQDLAVGQTHTRYSFRETTGPLFFQLADLLLQRASNTARVLRTQSYLLEARNTIERFKAAELQDYFQDECVADLQARTTGFDRISSHTIVVYPILLKDRTELLLSLPQGMRQVTVAVGRARLTREIAAFRSLLEKRTTREYLPHAQRLYRWLIRPIEPALEKHKVDTLVYVPGGALRTIPIGALHDGERFLIERYALVTTPGLTLTDPEPIERDDVQVLAIGLTEPVQGFPALTYVSSELKSIGKLYPSTQLRNEQFLISNVQRELAEVPYSIVHIASHGQFASRADQSFVLTFDDKLTMNRLEQLIGLGRYRTDPVELLTLSACQTAAGDARAALGLAGVAIKAGARSALATLWLVNDQAASLLISEFYRQLQRPQTSKAQALQQAQIKLQSDPRYEHPGYWSAFLIIGNWL